MANRVNTPSTKHLNHVVVSPATSDDLLSDVYAHLVDHTQNISLSRRRIWTKDKVRTSEGVEMNGVIGAVKRLVEQLAYLLDCGGWLDIE